MQSGRALLGAWVLEYTPTTPRRPEPLMGWIGSADTNNQVQIQFPSRDAAVAFARKNGWSMDIEEAHTRKVVPKNYASNFVWQKPKTADAR